MSDGGRWRRVYSGEWHAPAFQNLTDAEARVYFYVKTGPQSTSVGIYRVSTAVAVEDLGKMRGEEFDSRLDVVCRTFDWRFDPTTRVLWMPRWLKENPPQSPNVCVSWRKLLENLPDCDLKFEAMQSIAQQLADDFPKGFRKAFGKSFESLSEGLGLVSRKQGSSEQGTGSREQGSREQGASDQGVEDRTPPAGRRGAAPRKEAPGVPVPGEPGSSVRGSVGGSTASRGGGGSAAVLASEQDPDPAKTRAGLEKESPVPLLPCRPSQPTI